ncbi:hypothetical protein Tco_0189631 [Tanacetum coccineum]
MQSKQVRMHVEIQIQIQTDADLDRFRRMQIETDMSSREIQTEVDEEQTTDNSRQQTAADNKQQTDADAGRQSGRFRQRIQRDARRTNYTISDAERSKTRRMQSQMEHSREGLSSMNVGDKEGRDLIRLNQCNKVYSDTNVALGYLFRRVIRARDERRKRYNRIGDHRKLKIGDWDIGKDMPLDDDDDAGKERYWDRGDSFHDLKHDEGNDDTRNQKRKHDDRGHDERRERYRDRGDRYGRKRYYTREYERGGDERKCKLSDAAIVHLHLLVLKRYTK